MAVRRSVAAIDAVRRNPGFAAVALGALALAIYENFFRLASTPLLADEWPYMDAGWRLVHWGSLSPADQAPQFNNFEHPPFAKILFGAAQALNGHESLTPARLVAASMGLLACLILAVWIGHVAGRWTGLAAGSLSALLPVALHPTSVRFDRSIMLDSVAMPFVVLSAALCWYWFRSDGRRAWLLAVGTGVAIGLATASKEAAFLILAGPGVLGLIWSLRRDLLQRLLQAATAGTVAVLVFLVTYLPFGSPFPLIEYMLTFQAEHSSRGHAVVVHGVWTMHPPWWSVIWFAWNGIGHAVMLALVALALAGAALRRDRLVAWLMAAVFVPFLFHAFVAGVVLPFYWILWFTPACALSALGLSEIAQRCHPGRDTRIRLAYAATAVMAVLPLTRSVAIEVAAVADVHPSEMARVSAARTAAGLGGAVAILRERELTYAPYLLGTPVVVGAPDARLGSVDTVLVGHQDCRGTGQQALRAAVWVAQTAHTMTPIVVTPSYTLFRLTKPLVEPTAAQMTTERAGAYQCFNAQTMNQREAAGNPGS